MKILLKNKMKISRKFSSFMSNFKIYLTRFYWSKFVKTFVTNMKFSRNLNQQEKIL